MSRRLSQEQRDQQRRASGATSAHADPPGAAPFDPAPGAAVADKPATSGPLCPLAAGGGQLFDPDATFGPQEVAA